VTSYATVAELRAYLPQVPEYGQQLITLTGTPTGGTFTLGYEGASGAALAYNATATAVQTALRAITAIGMSGVNVRGRPGGPYTATFQGTLATDAGPLTLDANGLTGGSVPSVTIVPATDSLLQKALDRATDIVRTAMRSLLADETFDYAAYGAASTAIVRGVDTFYLRLPPHQAGSTTLVEYQSGSNPSSYTALTSDQWEATADGTLYRAAGWGGGLYGDYPRYRVTAVWGYGTPAPDAIVETVLEVAVNIWRTRDSGGFAEVVGVEGSGGMRQIAGLTKQQAAVLENLRDQLIQVGV
jgi:hypothetical protein